MQNTLKRCIVGFLFTFALTLPCMVCATTPLGTEAGSERYYVENNDTEKTEVTNCQVNVEVTVPDGFFEPAYVVFQGEDGTLYRVTLLEENGYSSKIYVSPGHYTVLDAGIYENDTFSFDMDTVGFNLEQDEDAETIRYCMAHFDNIRKDESGKYVDTVAGEVITEDMTLYTTPFKNIKMDGAGVLYYEVKHDGKGKGTLRVSGNEKGDYDIQIKITKSGVIGEAEYIASYDGGETFVESGIITDTMMLQNSNLTYSFTTEKDTEELKKGDFYTFSTMETFFVSTSSSPAEVQLILSGHPLKKHELSITILSSGGLGKSKFHVVDEKGAIEEVTDTIPENGQYFLDDGLILMFKPLDGYAKNITFYSSINSNDTNVSYMPLYILILLVVVIAIVFFIFLILHRDKPAQYRLQKYEWRQEEEAYN